MLSPGPANQARLSQWIQTARAADCQACTPSRGLELDMAVITTAITPPFHNGRTEGVNTRIEMIKRQMYGRAGFALLRHRILLS